MKILIISLVVLAAVVIGFIPVYSTHQAEDAFSRINAPDSPEQLDSAIRLKMRFYQFKDARAIAERAIVLYPESPYIDSYIYCAALCAERMGNKEAELHWNSRFLELFPEHSWTPLVKDRLEKLKGSGNGN